MTSGVEVIMAGSKGDPLLRSAAYTWANAGPKLLEAEGGMWNGGLSSRDRLRGLV